MDKPSADVEMKPSEESKPAEKKEEKYDPFFEIKRSLVLLEKAVKDKDLKQCAAIQRGFKWIWKEISLKDVGQIFEYFLPHLAARMNLPNYDRELVPTDLKAKFHTTAEKA